MNSRIQNLKKKPSNQELEQVLVQLLAQTTPLNRLPEKTIYHYCSKDASRKTVATGFYKTICSKGV